MPDYMFLLESRLTPEQRAVVMRVVELAQGQGINVYLAGGAVRDLICGMSIRDLDFTFEGNPSRIARELEKGGARIYEEDEDRRHFEMLFHGDVDGSLGAARDDVYEHPGAKPQFRFNPILDDLRRRDFSVNAIALSLNAASRGLLLDPMNGLADLERREIRLLSMHGFTNQPGRLLRALRYAARLGFVLEERTAGWFDLALERKLHHNISAADIVYEVRQVAREDNAAGVLKSWDSKDLLVLVHSKFASRKPDYKALEALMQSRDLLLGIGRRGRFSTPVLYYMFGRLTRAERSHTLKHIGLRAHEIQAVAGLEELADQTVKAIGSAKLKDPRAAFDFLEKLPTELIAFIETYTRQAVVLSRVKAYVTKWKPLRTALPATQLEALGVPRGPKFDQVLDSFFNMQLHGRVRSPEDFERILRNLAGIKVDLKKKILPPAKKGKDFGRPGAPYPGKPGAPAGKPAPQPPKGSQGGGKFAAHMRNRTANVAKAAAAAGTPAGTGSPVKSAPPVVPARPAPASAPKKKVAEKRKVSAKPKSAKKKKKGKSRR
jgi:tRNA nucleotidyltransferase/poly(A) polymerase